MPQRLSFFLLLALSFPLASFGQQTLSDYWSYETLSEGQMHLVKHRYVASINKTEDFINQSDFEVSLPYAIYLRSKSKLKLENKDAIDDFEQMVDDFPANQQAMLAHYELGDHFFQDENYEQAIYHFNEVNADLIDRDKRLNLAFKMGYSYLSMKNLEEALPQFEQSASENSPYALEASYYAGYIHYSKGRYKQALDHFDGLMNREDFQVQTAVMKALSHYHLQDDQGLVSFLSSLGDFKKYTHGHWFYFLKGELERVKENYKEAIAEYSEFLKKENKPPRAVTYKIAFVQYMGEGYQEAINGFKEVAIQEDTLGQLAAYYLGISYLYQDQKILASAALDQARRLDFLPYVKADAWFNLGKSYFNSEEYGKAIEVMRSYAENYQDHDHLPEAQDIIGKSYFYTQDYDAAIEYAESLPNPPLGVRQSYQRSSFLKAAELYNAKRYQEAINYCNKALAYKEDKSLTANTYFTRAESYQQLEDFGKSLPSYRSCISVSTEDAELLGLAYYGAAYARYNNREYKEALENFLLALAQQLPDKILLDSRIRKADCYYAIKDFPKALKAYEELISDSSDAHAPYALYQQGVVHYAMDDYEPAAQDFKRVMGKYRRSKYALDASFQLGQVKFMEGSYDKAIDEFNALLDKLPKENDRRPEVLMRRALAYSNLGNHELSARDYKYLLEDYPSHPSAKSALIGLQEALTQSNEIEEFDEYLAKYRSANPESEALEDIEYETAKSLYFSQKYDKAIDKFLSFMASYPNSSFLDDATFYTAEAYYRKGNLANAKGYYKELLRTGKGYFINRAYQRLADVEQTEGNCEEALNYYVNLEEVANSSKQKFQALTGRMICYFDLGKLDSSAMLAKSMLNSSEVGLDAENNALFYSGKIAEKEGNLEEAIDFYISTANNARDEIGARALFNLAQVQNRQEKYRASIETLYSLNKNYSIYKEWYNKSFLLIAQNFIELEEYFQAKATLRTIIEKAEDQETVKEAKLRLEEVEQITAQPTEEELIVPADSIKNDTTP